MIGVALKRVDQGDIREMFKVPAGTNQPLKNRKVRPYEQ